MEMIDDEDDIRDSLQALDHIKSWALDNMGAMREPKPRGDESSHGLDGETEDVDAHGMPDDELAAEAHDDSMVMEQPMSQPAMRTYDEDNSRKEKPTVLDVYEPGVRRPSEMMGAKPPPKKPDPTGMDEWTDKTVQKLDKFGKKIPRR